MRGWAGSRPGRAATSPRGAGKRTPAASASWRRSPGTATAPPAGRNGSRMAGAAPVAHGPWVVAEGHPACRRPGQAEQTAAQPASPRTSRQGPLDVAGRAAARSPVGGSAAYGMAGTVRA